MFVMNPQRVWDNFKYYLIAVEELFYLHQEKKKINIDLGLLINRLHMKKLVGAYNERMLLSSYKPAFL